MANKPIKDKTYTHTVAMFDSNGDPVQGLTKADINVYIKKPGDNGSTEVQLQSGEFFEIDNANMSGLYGVFFNTQYMDVAGEITGSVTASPSLETDLNQYNFRFTIEDVTHKDLQESIETIELESSNVQTEQTFKTQSVKIENFPEHYVAEIKQGETFTFDFKIVDPKGNPIKGIVSSDIDVQLLSGGTPVNPSNGTGQAVSSSIKSTFTEIDTTNAPGWYSLELDASDTANLGDLAVELILDGVEIDGEGAETQNVPQNYEVVTSIFMRDQIEGYATTIRTSPESGGQLADTSNGGDDWNILSSISNNKSLSGVAGYFDVDGDDDPGEYAAIGVRETQNGSLLLIAYDYGSGLQSRILREESDVAQDIFAPSSLSELQNRSWYTFASDLVANYHIEHWNRLIGEIEESKLDSDKNYEDIYALEESEHNAQNEILEASQDVSSEAALINDETSGFQRVVFEDDTTGELVYIDNEGGSWGPRSIIDSTDNPGKPSIVLDYNSGNPVLGVVFERKDVGDIVIAQYDFSGGSSVTDSSWNATVIDTDTNPLRDPDATIDDNGNVFVTYRSDDAKTLFFATDKSGSWVTAQVWVSGGTRTAGLPSITLNVDNPNGDVTIGSSFASGGTNIDEVATFDEPDPLASNWNTQGQLSEGSVTEDEFSRKIGIDWTDDPNNTTGKLYIATFQKNQNTVNGVQLKIAGDSTEVVEELNDFEPLVNFKMKESNPDFKQFFYINTGVPFLTHSSEFGYHTRQLRTNTNLDLPIASSQWFDDGDLIYFLSIESTNLDLEFSTLDLSSNDTVIAVGDDEVSDDLWIIKTTDGGDTWSQSTTPTTNDDAVRGIDFVDTSEGYAVSRQGRVLQTTDGGNTWSEVSQNADVQWKDVWARAPGELEVVGVEVLSGGDRKPRHSTSIDGGTTLERKTITEDISSSNQFFKVDGSGDECWITGQNGEIIHCFNTVSFSGGRSFRFQVVERYEAETYNLVDSISGTISAIDTKTTDIKSTANDIDSTTTSIESTTNDIDTKTTDIKSTANDIDSTTTSIDSKIDTVLDQIKNILGIQGNNYRAKNYQFDSQTGKLQSVEWYIYDNQTDLQNDQNPIAAWDININIDSNGNPIDYVSERIL